MEAPYTFRFTILQGPTLMYYPLGTEISSPQTAKLSVFML